MDINLEGVLTACKHIYLNNVTGNVIKWYPVGYYPHILCPYPGVVKSVSYTELVITLDNGDGDLTLRLPILLGGYGTSTTQFTRYWPVGKHVNAGDVLYRFGVAIQYGADQLFIGPHGGNPCVIMIFPGDVNKYIDVSNYINPGQTWLYSNDNIIDYDHGFSAVFQNFVGSGRSDFFVTFVEDGKKIYVVQEGKNHNVSCEQWIDDETLRWIYDDEMGSNDGITITSNRCITAGYVGRVGYNTMRIGIRAYGAGPNLDAEGDNNYVQPVYTHYAYSKGVGNNYNYLVPVYKYTNWGDTDLIPMYCMPSLNLPEIPTQSVKVDWTDAYTTINTTLYGDYLYILVEPVLFPRPHSQGVMWTYRLRYGKTDSTVPPFKVGDNHPIFWWYEGGEYKNKHYNCFCYNNYLDGIVGYIGNGVTPENGSYYIVGHNAIRGQGGDDSIIPILTMLSSHNTAMPSINRFLRPR